MNTESNQAHLLIALPRLLCFKSIFNQTIDSVLNTLGKIDITLVENGTNEAKLILQEKGIKPRDVSISTRLEARSALHRYSHVLVFWDGDDATDIVYYAKLFNKHLRIVPVEITKVKNRDNFEEFDVYIGRRTPWGNPFPIEHETDGKKRNQVIEMFKTYFYDEIVSNPEKLKQLLALKGMRLGCHCKPLPCHGDVIADFLNSYEEKYN